MPVTRTLAQMRQEVRDLADEPSTVYITDAMIDRWLNAGLRKVYEMAYMADPIAYDLTLDTSITTVANTVEYTLPTALWKLTAVDLNDGSEWRALKPLKFYSHRNHYSASTGQPSRYMLRGRTALRLYPTPSSAYALRVWYVPAYTVLSNDSDTFDGLNGWEEYGVLDAVAKVKLKKEDSINEVLAMQAAIMRDIEERATERDMLQSEGIQPTKGDYWIDDAFGLYE